MKSAFYEHIPSLSEDGGSSLWALERREASFPFAWHYHPEYELTYIVRSSGTRLVGDHISPYTDGDLVLLGPNLPHTWESDGVAEADHPMIATVLQFREDLLGDSFLHQPELRQVRELLHQRAPLGVHWPDPPAELLARLRALPTLQGLPRLLGLLEILGQLAELPADALCSPDYAPSVSSPERQRLERVTDYIQAHFREPLSLGDVADVAAMSPSHFSRYFKRATRLTFVSYVNQLRVGWVCRRLLETDDSIAQAAYAAGFNNLANFNRRFRDIKSMSPSQYLQRFKA